MSYSGQSLGVAEETLAVSESGFELRRLEHYDFLRRGVPVRYEVRLVITGPSLEMPTRARSEFRTKEGTRVLSAARDDNGEWIIAGDGRKRRASADHVPIEIVDHLLAQTPSRQYSGKVLLSTQGFDSSTLTIEPGPDARRLKVSVGPFRSQATIDHKGHLIAMRGPGRYSLRRIDKPRSTGERVDLLVASSVPILGQQTGAIAFMSGDGERHWSLHFEDTTPDDEDRDLLRHMAGKSNRAVIDELDPAAFSTLTRGDCNTHALHLARAAKEAGLDARIASGFRRQGSTLWRHRWVQIYTRRGWVAVDPSFSEVAPSNRLLTIAVHGPPFEDFTEANARFQDYSDVAAQYIHEPIATER
jgi:hypothetical protein